MPIDLTIYGDPPPSLNTLLRSHWAKRKRAKDQWVRNVGHAMMQWAADTQRPMSDLEAQGRRRLDVDLYFHTVRRRDPDNYLKVLMDALVSNRLIIDDNPAQCKWAIRLHVDKAQPRTEIRLEEMGDD